MSVFDWKGKPSTIIKDLQQHERRVANGSKNKKEGATPIHLPGNAAYCRTKGMGADWSQIQPEKKQRDYAR